MIAKFSDHGKGKASGVLNYLLKEKGDKGALMPRTHAKVLYGDPVLTEHLINTTPYKSKYKSGYLSFSERADEISEADKKRIMQEFEAIIFCGLEGDQYDILWVEHADKDIDDAHPVGRLELNFVIPCQELRSGKAFQPYYEPADQKRVNAWKNIINSEVKTIQGEPLSDPNDPERKRLVNPYSSHAPRPTPFDMKVYTKKDADKDEETIANPPSRTLLEEAIKRRLLLDWQNGILMNRRMVLGRLEEWGLKINRGNSEKTLSVTSSKLTDKNGKPIGVRLKGGMFEKGFDGLRFRSHNKEWEQAVYDHRISRNERKQSDEELLATGIKIKEAYHQERYRSSATPESLVSDKVVEQELEVAEPATTETYRPSLRPRF
uniref:relaxase/mobilization nuclease domain-containing protein n=1 Tax=Psychrobacter sp. TaxID=56811 RepID=UPI00159A9929|nr:relaxase/mobilization nuclease domain-containing protein [Psychrobacter sp.]QJS05263.1 mobilization protein MobA, relaxase [Psychrobacter sp.]